MKNKDSWVRMQDGSYVRTKTITRIFVGHQAIRQENSDEVLKEEWYVRCNVGVNTNYTFATCKSKGDAYNTEYQLMKAVADSIAKIYAYDGDTVRLGNEQYKIEAVSTDI